MREYTHPDVLGRGVAEGWADPETDPTRINWAVRQARAAIPFKVVHGRPVNPFGPTGITRGRNELGHWGEAWAADAVVTADHEGGRWLAMVERSDGHGWALPGGFLDDDFETPVEAAVRELAEETGLTLNRGMDLRPLARRYVPDPRASDEAWIVTTPVRADLGPVRELPALTGADDARRAEWVAADSYNALTADLKARFGGTAFTAHRGLLAELLG